MYYILDIVSRVEGDAILKGTLYNGNGDLIDEIFDDGISCKNKISGKLSIIVNEKNYTHGKITDKLNGSAKDAGFILIISNSVKKHFLEFGIKNCEFYDVSVLGKKLKTSDYVICNVLGKIDCIDDTKSEIKYSRSGVIKNVYSLTLDETKIDSGLDIFLLGKFSQGKIVISENLKKSLEDNNFTGFNFISTNEFTY